MKKTIRIFAINESLNLFDFPDVSKYYIKGTYKCIPHSVNSINVLILLIGYNKRSKQFEICLCAAI